MVTGIQWADVSGYFLLVVTEYQDKAFVKTGGLAHGSRGCKSKDMLLAPVRAFLLDCSRMEDITW